MSDLDNKEQQHVRAALRYLHRRIGTWKQVAEALRFAPTTIDNVLCGRAVSPTMALRVARLCGVMIDDLLVGRFFPPGACPNCGHVIGADFKDESTIVEDAPRQPAGGLTVVK